MGDIRQVFDCLRSLLAQYRPPLVPVADSETRYELQFDRTYRTRSEMTGKVVRKHGLYFAGVVLRPSYVALYFMPVYSHRDAFGDLPHCLAKLLKGKSCFHIKSLDQETIDAITGMLARGFDVYQSFTGAQAR